MKKFFALLLLLFFTIVAYADTVSVRVIVQGMDLISPDGEVQTFSNIEDVPPIIPYSSQIIAKGMTIISYHSVGIVLKNQQGLFVTKHPITNAMIFSKIENSRSGPIVITFDSTTTAQMSPDGTFSLKYDEKNNNIILEILEGYLEMKVQGTDVELIAGETYKHSLNKE